MITVFTPTFNRAYTLERLFKSLMEQSCRDFEWVVVDDGSNDNTRELLETFSQTATFPMRYEVQENSGKHVAINRGAAIATGEWFFIVDSDDWLPEDSIEINSRYLSQVAEDHSFAGVSGARARADGSVLISAGKTLDDCEKVIQERFALKYIDATSQDFRCKYNMPGERAEIVRTSLVREFPFPAFAGEKFVSEYYLWQSISEKGLKLRWFSTPTYCGDYLGDGLSTNLDKVMLKSPLGRSFIDNFVLRSHAPIAMKLKSAVNYTRYGRLAGKKIGELGAECSSKTLFILGLPIAMFLPLADSSKGN